jgi:hypothetical protein
LRKREDIKINKVTIEYNQDVEAFEIFMESMILDYLNSFSIAKTEPQCFIGKVEKEKKSA